MSFGRCSVTGWGHHLPGQVVSNRELARLMGNCSEAELRVAGIETRCFAAEGLGSSHLGLEAARAALAQAGLSARQVDFLVFATMSPDFVFPGGGCLLQDKLGCPTIGALDVRAQCTGFLQALLIGEQFIATGTYRNVLVVGSEVLSSYLEPGRCPVAVAASFGDGAGALVLSARDGAAPIPLTVALHTDASRLEDFWCEFPASRSFPQRVTVEHLRAGRHLPRLSPSALVEMAREKLPEVIGEVLGQAGVGIEDIAKLLVQVVDASKAEAIGVAAGFSPGQIVAVGERTGTVGAAALPVGLALQRAAGAVRSGDVVCLASFGAGLNWGAAVFQV